MDMREIANVEPQLPQLLNYEMVLYCATAMQNYRLSSGAGLHCSLSSGRALPRDPHPYEIPFPENIQLLQLHDFSRVFIDNRWVETLASALLDGGFFSTPKPSSMRRVCFIYINHEDLTKALVQASIEDIANSFFAMLRWLSDKTDSHIIFAGMTVNSRVAKAHPAHFLNCFQLLLKDKRETGMGDRVYYHDFLTLNFPEQCALQSGNMIKGYVEKCFHEIFPKLVAYTLQHLDVESIDPTSEVQPDTTAENDEDEPEMIEID
jgi:hypothetical protein